MPTASRPVVTSAPLMVLAAALVLSGCSSLGESLQGDKVDYKSATKGASLAVPPDLTQLSRETRYVVPGTAVTASGYQVGQTTQSVPTAASTVGDVRIERAGSQRWLVVNRPADKLWGPVREFWQESGFLMALDQENLGIMETDYAENRAKLPQDFIRATLGKLLDNLYSTGERDKFRTRLERTPTGATEIYISHRGMVETVQESRTTGPVKSGESTIWQPRPADPELEAEFLRRLMVKLGVTQEQSKALVASGTSRQTARVANVNNVPVVQIDEGFERAWRRVGLALDRTGFTVEDRDRAQGTYFVRYVEPTADKKEPGFFAKMFRSPAAIPPLKYRIAVRSQAEATTVSVLNEQGAPDASANARRIVQVIADDLR
ncbi:MAG: outer membrane protein assembly factor BamC [Polaromonas sp.]|uniref:outer membrane protein assembly factor BamC n=1 Tax=Polaromonas sp. TaxID=1869339 RepID=UPI0027336DC2|nr:outer membrane protein assembly factor BamC [Polaromonas sp.]MDP2817636.1 outer membrane protein assembly factor BamC [Polaromonas sp.]